MKNINVDRVDYNQKEVYYQARNHCHDGDHCQYHSWDRPLSDGNRCQNRDPCQDGDEHIWSKPSNFLDASILHTILCRSRSNLTMFNHNTCSRICS